MSQNKTKKEYSESFNGFGGLDVTSPIGSGKLLTFRNFRLLPDGSAVKRSGFSYICTLDGEIRGEKTYSDGNEEVILAAVGRSLVRVNVLDGTVTSKEIFESSAGSVKFFEFGGELYLVDGCALYRYEGGCEASRCQPYVPLYGEGWSTYQTVANKVNEPFNALTPRIRITFNVTGSQVGTVYVGLKIKSIDGIWGSGKLIAPAAYKIHADGDKIVFYEYYFTGELSVLLTLDTEDYRNADFESCDRSEVFDAFEDSRVFVFGGDDARRLYVSSPVSEDAVCEQEEVYGFVAPIYFPNDEPVRFSGENPVNGVCRIFDRALLFSEFRAWVTSSLRTDEGRSRRGLLLETATDSAGCSSKGAVSIIGGANPVTVSHSGIYKWSIDDEFEEEMRLTRLSGSVEPLLDGGFSKNALVCRNRGDNELWFANKASENGSVLVYNCDSGVWYAYDGIVADALFEVGDTVAFRSQNSYYIFLGEEGYDCFEWGERDIEAVIESADFDFSQASVRKHIVRGEVTCELDGGELTLELSDGNRLFFESLEARGASATHGETEFFDIRMRTSRIQRARFRLSAPGRSRQRIYGVAFFAS